MQVPPLSVLAPKIAWHQSIIIIQTPLIKRFLYLRCSLYWSVCKTVFEYTRRLSSLYHNEIYTMHRWNWSSGIGWRGPNSSGSRPNIKIVCPGVGIPIMMIRRSRDYFLIIIRILRLISTCYIEIGPGSLRGELTHWFLLLKLWKINPLSLSIIITHLCYRSTKLMPDEIVTYIQVKFRGGGGGGIQ